MRPARARTGRSSAFTGAAADQEGVFEAANGGTIFLDEIGEMPMAVQSALLRVFEEREITRVGDSRPRAIDVRIVTATNRDLGNEVKAGRFREDLLYRVRVATIPVPPLRERTEDIPLLVSSFLPAGRAAAHKRVQGLDPAAMQRLMEHSWPGNVRELKNAIETAIVRRVPSNGTRVRTSSTRSSAPAATAAAPRPSSASAGQRCIGG
jgi:transcriptional regulator with PAS, ATPase and Fis domain